MREVEALLKVAEVEVMGIERIVEFARELGIEVRGRNMLAGGGTAMLLFDATLDETYAVLLDRNGRVIDINVCFHSAVPPYLSEFIILCREQGIMVVHPPSGYEWLSPA